MEEVLWAAGRGLDSFSEASLASSASSAARRPGWWRSWRRWSWRATGGRGGGRGRRRGGGGGWGGGGGEGAAEALDFEDLGAGGALSPETQCPTSSPMSRQPSEDAEQAKQPGIAAQGSRARRRGRSAVPPPRGDDPGADGVGTGGLVLGLEDVEEGEADGRGGAPAGEAVALVGGERGAAAGAGGVAASGDGRVVRRSRAPRSPASGSPLRGTRPGGGSRSGPGGSDDVGHPKAPWT